MPPKGESPLEASNSEPLEVPFHNSFRKVGGWVVWLTFKPDVSVQNVPILFEKVNRNYGLGVERLHGREVFKKHSFRKEDGKFNQFPPLLLTSQPMPINAPYCLLLLICCG